jgi:hypothetical protein
MVVSVVAPEAQPIVSFAGRTVNVVAGPQDCTAGCDVAVVVVVEAGALVVDPCVVRDGSVADDLFVGGEVLDPTLHPMANPTPRAATTSAPTPTRTIVLRRMVMTRGSALATGSHGSSARCRSKTRCDRRRPCGDRAEIPALDVRPDGD